MKVSFCIFIFMIIISFIYNKENNNNTRKSLEDYAAEGSADAQYMLSLQYRRGNNKDYEKYVYWSKLSSEQGYTFAQYEMGQIYYQGIGVNRDYQEAFRWYRIASNSGHILAQYAVANMYYYGNGVNVNYMKSYMWAYIALENSRDEYDRAGPIGLMYDAASQMTASDVIDYELKARICIDSSYAECD